MNWFKRKLREWTIRKESPRDREMREFGEALRDAEGHAQDCELELRYWKNRLDELGVEYVTATGCGGPPL